MPITCSIPNAVFLIAVQVIYSSNNKKNGLTAQSLLMQEQLGYLIKNDDKPLWVMGNKSKVITTFIETLHLYGHLFLMNRCQDAELNGERRQEE